MYNKLFLLDKGELKLKITVLYQTRSGNTERVAKLIEDGAKKVDGVDIKLMRLDNIDLDYLNESKAVIFGTPTYLANTTWEVKKWFYEDSKKVNLAGKLGAVFATCDYICGGPDVAILTIVGHLMVKGMLVYSGGGSLGKPFIHLGHVHSIEGPELQDEKAIIFGERIATKAKELFA